MTQWIQSSNVKQDGTPVTRAIKIPEMSEEIWFTTNAYAEVSQTVGDLLANQLESISKVSEPATPGEYYGEAGANTTVQLVLADKSFNDLSVTGTADIAETETERAVIGGTDTVPSVSSPRKLAESGYLQTGEGYNDGPVLQTGTVMKGTPTPFVGFSDATTTSTTFEKLAPSRVIGPIHSPSGMIPCLSLHINMQSQDSGEWFEALVTTQNRGTSNPLWNLRTGTGTDTFNFEESIPLHNKDFGTSHKDNTPRLEIYGKVSGGTSGGLVSAESTYALEYEVM